MKRLALIVTVVLLGVGVALWVSQSYVGLWEPRFRAQLENRLGAALHARVRIEEISISFLYRARLKNVEIWDTREQPETLLFRANEIALTANLIDLPRALYHRNPLEVIGSISVNTPFIALSPEWIARQRGGKTSGMKPPPWLTVKWTQGTLQWKDLQAPHGAWTLYQAQGAFRIRGPRVDTVLQGSLEQAQSVQLQMATLGRRWSGQAHFVKGDIPGVVSLTQRLLHRPILPATWKTQGQFNLDMKFGGRLPVSLAPGFGELIKEAQLDLSNTQLEIDATTPPIQLNGGVSLKKGRVDFSALTIKTENTLFNIAGHMRPFAKGNQLDVEAASPQIDLALLSRYATPASEVPFLHGTSAVSASLKGSFAQPEIKIHIPQGILGQWPFENARFQMRRAETHWEIEPSTLQLWQGTLTLKGQSALHQMDLQLTGNDMSLSKNSEALKGRLNFSLSLHGDADGFQTTGSYWINNFSWAQSYAESLRGEVAVTPTHFKLSGASENRELRLQADGIHTAKLWTLQQLLIQLRDRTTLSAKGTYAVQTKRLHGNFDAKNISLVQDLPGVPTQLPSLKGHANVQGIVEGPLQNLVLKAELDSQDIQVGTSSASQVTASLRWTPQALTVDADGTFENFAISKGALRFVLQAGRVDVQRFSMISTQGKADFKGQASWESTPGNRLPKRVTYRGEGRFASLNDGALWNLPCRIQGEISPTEKWKGHVNLDAPAVWVQGQRGDSLETLLRWEPGALQWEHFRLGPTITSQGAMRFSADHPELSGELHARDVSLPRWQTLFWPRMKEPVQGTLNAEFTLLGTPADPVLQFNGKVKKGVWRAFRFDTGVEGSWTSKGVEPLAFDATLETGGRLRFQGRVSLADQTASGSVDLAQVEIKPIGDSLAFPQSLESKANGTLTVSGPLSQLHFAGHLEGAPLVYAGKTANPFKLKNYVMDLKLEPVPDRSVTRLTITQALARTEEEEIRLNPGSYVEFAGPNEARVQIGSEIRNLHLGVFTLFGGLDWNGTWQIRPQGFALQGQLFTRSLYINDYQLEQGLVLVNYYDRILNFNPPRDGPTLVTGTVNFQKMPELDFKEFAVVGKEGETLHLSGTVGPKKWAFAMEGQGLDLSTLGGLAGFPYSLNGSANVKIRGTGDLDHPNVDGELVVQEGRALGLSFQSGAATFAWQGQRMTFTRLQLSDPGRYTLSGTGVFPLMANAQKNSDKQIDFSLRLTDANMGLLKSISHEVKEAKGSVQALLQVTGTTEAPQLRGSFRVKNGDVNGAHYFRHVEDVQIAADFDGNDLIISEFRGKSGRGEFAGGGHILFAGFKPKFYDLQVNVPSSKGIDVTVPELAIPESPLAKKLHFLEVASRGIVKGRVTFRGPAEEPVFFGEAFVSNGHFSFPPSRKNPPPPAFLEWIRRVVWDVTLHFSDDAWFENELVEANLIGALAIKGPSQRLKVDGGMDISDGKISYLGVEFDIRQARYEIHSSDNGTAIVTTPYVRGVADSLVQTVDPISGQGTDDTITLTINFAPVNEIKPQLRSSLEPTLTQDKVLARVTQLESDKLTPQERTYLYQQQMVRLLDTSLATPLARSLLKRTGLVDQVRVSRVINPANAPLPSDVANPTATQQDTATNLLAGTKYTLAKNLSNRLSLGYGVRFEQITNQDLTNKLDLRSEVEMSYRFLKNVYVRGSFDLPDTTPGGVLPDRKVTIEPHWRFGWWGNTNKPKKPKVAPPTEASDPASPPHQ